MVIAQVGLPQGTVCREIGCRPETLSRLAGGNSASIGLDVLVALAEWTHERGLSVLWLFTGEGEMHTLVPPAPGTIDDRLRQIVREELAQGRPRS